MKNITKSVIALFAIFAVACTSDDVEDRPTIVAGDAPVLLAPDDSNIYNLVMENSSMQAERFVWTPATFGEDIEITYTVEIDEAGEGFANAQSVGSVNGSTQLSVSVGALNTAIMNLGAEAFVANSFDVRVKATTASSAVEPLYSQTVTITVTPFAAIDPVLFLVGAPQSHYGLGEWDNTTAIPMRYIGDGITKLFEAYVKVNTDQGFKFIGEQGTWDNGNYGTNGGAQDGNLLNDGGSSDIKVAETTGPGLYYVRVNIDAMTYQAVKMDWGIIGDSTPGGWNGETAMEYDFASNTFGITTPLTAGELKFRDSATGNLIYTSDGDWKFNVGNSDPMVAYDVNAPNFAITAGNYTLGLSIGFDGTATVTGL